MSVSEEISRGARTATSGALADRAGGRSQRSPGAARAAAVRTPSRPAAGPRCLSPPQAEGRGTRRGRGRAADRSPRAPGPALSVSVCCGGAGEECLGHLRVEPGRVGVRPTSRTSSVPPRRERATSCGRGRITRPGWTTPSTVTTASLSRRRGRDPRGRRRERARSTASGRSTAARSPTSPPSEWPIHGAGSASSTSSTSSTASGEQRSSVGAAARAPEPPWPGRPGRSRAAIRGQRRRDQPPVAPRSPPSPWTRTTERPARRR